MSVSKAHQGWVDEELLAARPGLVLPVIKIPTRWLNRAVRAVRLLEREFGKPIRFLRLTRAIQVVFRSGTVLG